MRKQKTSVIKPLEAKKNWWLINAEDKVVGRLATEIADLLRGKKNPLFTPNADSGDFVVVINAEKVRFTGRKGEDKIYQWHTNHIGGLKQRTVKEQLAIHPELILMSAVKGMLPKTSLGRKQLTKLKVFAGAEHTHAAQNPAEYKV